MSARSSNRATGGAGPRRARHPAAGLEPVAAMLCTVHDFPGELSAHYPGACARLGLPPRAGGYALRLAQDEHGQRWTIVASDAACVSAALSIRAMGVEASLAVEPGDVERVLPGWPLPCPLGLAHRPAPHDPPDSDGLLRPEPPAWAPILRRGMADVIARELLEPLDAAGRELDWLDLGLNPADLSPRALDLMVHPLGGEHGTAVAAALGQARAMAAEGAPAGAVRAVRYTDRTVLVRATAATWSLVARPRGGPAVLLLDQVPGCGLEISGVEGLDVVLAELDGSVGQHSATSVAKEPAASAISPVSAQK